MDLHVVPAGARHRVVAIEERVLSFTLGDHISILCRVSRECHIWIANLGAAGKVTTLLPNKYRTGGPLAADQWHEFPSDHDPYSYPLLGPSGTEQIIAIALNTELPRPPPNDALLRNLSVGDILHVKQTGAAVAEPLYVLGIATRRFEVTSQRQTQKKR